MIHFTSLTDRAVNLPKHATPQIDPHLHAGTTSATASKYWEHEAHCYKARFDLALDALEAATDYIVEYPPSDGRGLLDHDTNRYERQPLLADIRDVLKACGR